MSVNFEMQPLHSSHLSIENAMVSSMQSVWEHKMQNEISYGTESVG